MSRYLLLILSLGCASAPPSPPRAEAPTLLVVGARLPARNANAILVRNGRIEALGDASTLRSEAGAMAQVIDAGGAWVLPGFHDAHLHLLSGGLSLVQLDLSGAESPDAVAERLAAYAQAHPERAVIIGRGWSYDLVPAGSFPTRATLDAVVADRPVYLESYDGHAWWLSSKALAQAGITRDTKEPAGARVVRDADGTPQGTLLEADALLESAPLEPDDGERREALRAAMAHMLDLGVTSADVIVDTSELEALRRMEPLPMRLRVFLPLDDELDETLRSRAQLTDSQLEFGGVKGFVDGVVESKTAYLLEPYMGATDRGAPQYQPVVLNERVEAAHCRGVAVILHAVGDAAVRLSLDAFEAARQACPDAKPAHRVEHIEVLHPDDAPRFASLGVTASMQPYHALPDGADPDGGVWAGNLGPERLKLSFPWRLLRDRGAFIAFGSDWPVMSANPLWGLAVATTRRDAAGLPAEGWNAHQALRPDEALNAYASPLSPGEPADLVILAAGVDPANPATLWKGRVDWVIAGGRPRRVSQ